MSSSAEFWSKIGQLRGVQPPSPELKKKPSEPTTAQENASKTTRGSLVFRAPQKHPGVKSPTNVSYDSTSSVSPSIGTSWNDIFEEDQAETATGDRSNGQVSLEYSLMTSTVDRQAKRLEETEATIDQQAQRIIELSGEVKTQACRIEHLEAEIEEKKIHLIELEDTKVKQDERILDLIHRAAEDACRAAQLKDELTSKATIIRQLELQVAENVSMPDSGSATEVEVDERTEDAASFQPEPEISFMAAKVEVLDAPVDPAKTMRGAIDATPAKPTIFPAASPVDDRFPSLSPVDFPALGTPTPVRDLRRSPFVTAENIRKMPPPPPARTLKLGIDTSKYLKKPAAGAGKFIFGSRRDTEGSPKIDVNKNIRDMPKAEREPFGFGPTVQIIMGNETVAVLPKYIFMQVSPRALQHWIESPAAPSIKFEAGSMTLEALNKILDWITMQTHCNHTFSVKLKEENTDRYNLELIRCARVLGLHSMYMGHFIRHYCERIRAGPSMELVILMEELVHTDDEPIFDCLANYMAMERSKVKPEDLGTWDQKLSRLPRLARKMQDVQAQKNFALGRTLTKKGLPPTKAAEEVLATTVTVASDIDPDAAWRAKGPAYV